MLIVSGIQPTGNLHLGNYLGAIRNWALMQDALKPGDRAFFFIADMHAITLRQDPADLKRSTREIAAALMAAGIDPEKAVLFNQSRVMEHAELAWVLGCTARIGWLNRMTQFKEKSGKDREGASVGLYTYPVLQAADVLLYKSTHVPVGEDQKQHLELARDIAGSFNRRFEVELFPLPEPMILGEATRVMSLRDGTKKMSKSDPSEQSRISLIDDADAIALKIRRAKSDSILGVSYDLEKRPEASNLLTIFAALAERPRAEIEAVYADTSFSEFKSRLAELAVEKLAPIAGEMRRLQADPGHLDRILRDGAERAAAIAEKVLAQAYDAVGFLAVR